MESSPPSSEYEEDASSSSSEEDEKGSDCRQGLPGDYLMRNVETIVGEFRALWKGEPREGANIAEGFREFFRPKCEALNSIDAACKLLLKRTQESAPVLRKLQEQIDAEHGEIMSEVWEFTEQYRDDFLKVTDYVIKKNNLLIKKGMK